MSVTSVAARRLVEPDFWSTYAGPGFRPAVVDTYGPIVADLCAAADYAPDPQQELALDLLFAFGPDDRPMSFATWVTAARQALKTGLMIQAAIGWVYVLEVREVLWTAHEAKTAGDSMESLSEVVQHPALSRLLPVQKNRGVYDENGDERVQFRTGQKVSFRTRTKNGARGVARVEKLIVDEGLALTARQQGAMFPVLAAKRGFGQILGGSSAPPIEGDVYRAIMDQGRAGAPRMNYLEWAADREPCDTRDCQHPQDALARGIDCALDREHLILQAYPTIHRDERGRALDTGRITLQTVRDLRVQLPPDEFMRECLVWRDEPNEHEALVPSSWWNTLADRSSQIVSTPRFALEVDEDQEWAAIGVAGANGAGRDHVEVTSEQVSVDELGEPVREMDYRPGTDWLVPRLRDLKTRFPQMRIAVAAGSAAMALKPDIEAAGVPVDVVKHADAIAACGYLVKQAKENELRHLGQASLNVALAAARKRNVGDGAWAFGRRTSVADICPLWAVALALWQHHTAPKGYEILDSVY